MGKKMELFSVMFWNVERFGIPSEERLDQVANHIQGLNPDLLCLCEVQDKPTLRSLLMDKFVEYDFAITESYRNVELLVGWRRGKFDQILFTQRRQFQSGSENLRPGALCSVKLKDKFFHFLFLHTDSGRKLRDYYNRQSMFKKIWELKRVLDDISEDGVRFVVMGDLNTMGQQEYRSAPALPSKPDISADDEQAALEEDAEANGMCMLPKTHDRTWRSDPDNQEVYESNLDHALATRNISFKSFEIPENSEPDSNCPKIRVNGWNDLEGCERNDFIKHVSDHCSIFLTVTC